MKRLNKLQGKRDRRKVRREKHYRRYVKRRAAGKKIRAAWQLKQFRRQKKAIRKLDRLIAEEQARLRKARAIDWNGHPALTYPLLLKAIRTALVAPGLYITSTTGGTHAPTSWHYSGKAFDAGSNAGDEEPEVIAQNLLLDTYGASYFAELFGPAGWYVKNGVFFRGTFPGHGDHLHVAVA